MKVVGIRELKDRLSEYIRMVRAGEDILVTDRGDVVAEIRKPGKTVADFPYPKLLQAALEGKVKIGGPNRPDLYVRHPPALKWGTVKDLLDEDRGER